MPKSRWFSSLLALCLIYTSDTRSSKDYLILGCGFNNEVFEGLKSVGINLAFFIIILRGNNNNIKLKSYSRNILY